eukprot:gene7644-5372_t
MKACCCNNNNNNNNKLNNNLQLDMRLVMVCGTRGLYSPAFLLIYLFLCTEIQPREILRKPESRALNLFIYLFIIIIFLLCVFSVTGSLQETKAAAIQFILPGWFSLDSVRFSDAFLCSSLSCFVGFFFKGFMIRRREIQRHSSQDVPNALNGAYRRVQQTVMTTVLWRYALLAVCFLCAII